MSPWMPARSTPNPLASRPGMHRSSPTSTASKLGLSDLLRPALPRALPNAGPGRRRDPGGARELHGADRPRPLGGPAAGAGHRERRMGARAGSGRRTAGTAGVRPVDGHRPMGDGVAQASDGVGIVYAEVDTARVASVRGRSRHLRTGDRRRTDSDGEADNPGQPRITRGNEKEPRPPTRLLMSPPPFRAANQCRYWRTNLAMHITEQRSIEPRDGHFTRPR